MQIKVQFRLFKCLVFGLTLKSIKIILIIEQEPISTLIHIKEIYKRKQFQLKQTENINVNLELEKILVEMKSDSTTINGHWNLD